MENLTNALTQFEAKAKVVSNETELQNIFKELAPAFLYGGYIKVREDYQVYIRTVEFYFHSEKASGIHDPIVYHRNRKDLETAPYFPPMSLHAHNSGFDITFESKTGEYRASVLIRSYEVKDMIKKCFLKWDTGKCRFVESDKYCYNSQSTYLKAVLNGFAFGNDNDVTWEEVTRIQSTPLTEKTRQNVFHYDENEGEYIKTKKKCERKWSFTREDPV